MPPAQRWLHTFPPQTHTTIEAWFRHVVSRGVTTPETILVQVTTLIGQALDWAATPERRQLCENVLQALRCDRAGALAHAQRLIDEQGA
jgi:hypothetical protein